ncbi:MAG: hypothetical protein DHS20C12_02490 [Pseudohongiella sp.]|nr:MAG: hypothetical protein DHS20C12_02490 [Pseudohongiella sp.]
MATKEDILEQIVEEYLINQGYFVQHNIKFLPRKDHPEFVSNKDSNHSDIDVLAFHPKRRGAERVLAVSCKSWQSGFNPAAYIAAIEGNKRMNGRQAWQGFRELCSHKWSEAFIHAVKEATGTTQFTHVLAVAHVKGDREVWVQHKPFREAMDGNPLRIVSFDEMVRQIDRNLGTTLAATEVGRLIQMFRAAHINIQEE